jgi:hypothetical protein
MSLISPISPVSLRLADFLLPMLNYSSENRAKPADLVNHAWLKDVIVQGEIDLMIEAAQKQAEQSGDSITDGPLSDPASVKSQLSSMGRI